MDSKRSTRAVGSLLSKEEAGEKMGRACSVLGLEGGRSGLAGMGYRRTFSFAPLLVGWLVGFWGGFWK